MSIQRMAVVFAVALTVGAQRSTAGQPCQINGKNVDLNVLFRYNVSTADIENMWKPLFRDASNLLFKATDGNLQFGTIRFHRLCAPRLASADVWISTGFEGASANPSGCGKIAQHISLSQLHARRDAGARGYFGLIHETGHYVFGLGDEYGGRVEVDATNTTPLTSLPVPQGEYMFQNDQILAANRVALPPLTSPYFYCRTQGGADNTCIMDGGTLITGKFHRTEFCSAHQHHGREHADTVQTVGVNPGDPLRNVGPSTLMTDQEANHKAEKDCWAVIKKVLKMATAPDPPVASSPNPETLEAGYSQVTFFEVPPVLLKRFVLLLDTSGSMMLDNRLPLMKSAARSFVFNAEAPGLEFGVPFAGDFVGVVAFSNAIQVVDAMGLVFDETQVVATIDALTAGGNTNLGLGLQAALNQLTNEGDPGCGETIILVSDGRNNRGAEPTVASVLPKLVARGAVVHAVAVGADPNGIVVLRSITDATGGRLIPASDPADLAKILADLQGTLRGSAVLNNQTGTLSNPATGTTPRVTAIPVPLPPDGIAGTCRFSVTGGGMTVRLISPDGTVYDQSSAGIRFRAAAGIQTFLVNNPIAGNWQVEVTRAAAGSGDYEVTATAPTIGTRLDVQVRALLDRASVPAEQMKLEAVLSDGPPIIGASVTAVLSKGGINTGTTTLVDNGNPAQGDNKPADGVYSALVSSVLAEGVHNVAVAANTAGAVLGSDEQGLPGTIRPPAQPATRFATTNTVVRTSAPGGTAAQVVNPLLRLLSLKSGAENGACVAGTSTFLVEATFQNTSTGSAIIGPFGKLTNITNGNQLLEQWFLTDEEEIVGPGRMMTGYFRIKLNSCAAFVYRTDITGVVRAASGLKARAGALAAADGVNKTGEPWEFGLSPETSTEPPR